MIESQGRGRSIPAVMFSSGKAMGALGKARDEGKRVMRKAGWMQRMVRVKNNLARIFHLRRQLGR